jgi:hypothetical protein
MGRDETRSGARFDTRTDLDGRGCRRGGNDLEPPQNRRTHSLAVDRPALIVGGGPSRDADLIRLGRVGTSVPPARILSCNEHAFTAGLQAEVCVATDHYHLRLDQFMREALAPYGVPILEGDPWGLHNSGLTAVAIAVLQWHAAPVWVVGVDLTGSCAIHRRYVGKLAGLLGELRRHVYAFSGPLMRWRDG